MSVTINGVSPTTAQQREFAAAMGLPVLLQTVTVGSAQQDIDFTGLNLDSDVSYRVEVIMAINAASDQSVAVYYNADTTAANYQVQLLAGDGSSAFAELRNNTTGAIFGGAPSATTQTLVGSMTFAKVTGKTPGMISDFIYMNAANIRRSIVGHRWNSSANVTAIKLRHTSNFGVGTVAKIYKV